MFHDIYSRFSKKLHVFKKCAEIFLSMMIHKGFWNQPYLILIFFDSTRKNNSAVIGFYSMIAVFVQFFGYGIGFMQAFWSRVVLGNKKEQVNI